MIHLLADDWTNPVMLDEARIHSLLKSALLDPDIYVHGQARRWGDLHASRRQMNGAGSMHPPDYRICYIPAQPIR